MCATDRLPAGYAEAADPIDCDDEDPDRQIERTLYVDEDGDRAGAGEPVVVCASRRDIPTGYAERGTDCAPQDPTRFAEVSYAHRDEDGDGATIPEAGVLCTDGTLPAGYRVAGGPLDCDDADPMVTVLRSAYADADLDGHGVAPQVEVCLPAELAAGWSADATDCDDTDGDVWRDFAYTHRDADLDGYTVEATGNVCVGTVVPPGFLLAASVTPDCDDNAPSLYASLDGYLDADGDGVGAGAVTAHCTGGTLPVGWVGAGGDCAPADAMRHTSRSYVAVDRDDDGVTAVESGTVCTDGTLPDPYRLAISGYDCDDLDPTLFALTLLFDDLDGDGVGAGPGRRPCLGTMLPAGTSPYGDDPDDQDSLVVEDDSIVELIVLEL